MDAIMDDDLVGYLSVFYIQLQAIKGAVKTCDLEM